MTNACGGGKPYVSPEELRTLHEKFRNETIKKFKSTPKMGGDEYSQPFLERLIEEVEVKNLQQIMFISYVSTMLCAVLNITVVQNEMHIAYWGSYNIDLYTCDIASYM